MIYSHESEIIPLNTYNSLISIYITNKENGENAQISYNSKLDKFSISSKNVTLLALQKSEIDEFEYIGKGHVLDIAKFFFSIIEKKNEKEILLLKKILNEFTFVGEYIGDIKYQHITFEKKNLIRFFGVVNKKKISNDYLRIDEAEKLVKECGFEFVLYDYYKDKKLEEIFDILEKFSEKCKFEGVDQIGEGFVVFFEPENIEENFDKRLILKLKGLEYRLQRAIREKAKLFKNVLENKKLDEDLKQKKIDQVEKLAIEKIRTLLIQHGLDESCEFFGKYTDVIKDVKMKIIQKELNPIFFGEYLYNLSKKYKKQEKEKTIENEEIQIGEQNQTKKEEDDEYNNNYPIIVILPIGISGLGKSYFGSNYLKKISENLNLEYKSINCDKLRETIISNALKQDPNLTKKKAFEKTISETAYKYRQLFETIIISSRKKKKDKNGIIIYSDKNYFEKTIKEAVLKIRNLLMGKNFKILLGVHKMEKSGFVSELKINDFFLCLYRIRNRNNNKMLEFKGFKTFQILNGFKNSFKNFFIYDLKIDGFLEYFINMEVENEKLFEEFEIFFKLCEDKKIEFNKVKKNKRNKKIKNEIKNIKEVFDGKKDLDFELGKLIDKLSYKKNGLEEKQKNFEINLEKKIKEILSQKKIPFFKELTIVIKQSKKYLFELIKNLKYQNIPIIKNIGNLNHYKKLVYFSIIFYKQNLNQNQNFKTFLNFKENEKIDLKITHFIFIEKLFGFFIVKNNIFKDGNNFFIFFTKKNFNFKNIFDDILKTDVLNKKGNSERFLKINQKQKKVIIFNFEKEINIEGTTKIFY